jgi:hypothetical protein
VAWLKSSDTAGHHPIVIAPLTWPVEDLEGLQPMELASLLFGLANRCALYSAQYTTDYAIADATVALMIGPRWRRWADLAAQAGFWERVDGGWMLVDDAEHLFHIRRKAEIDWEKARKTDVSNPTLTVPVRLRDGDGCRYCGHIVQWGARRGNRRGTYDHRSPGVPARSPDDLVVACGGCNSTRGANPDLTAWPLRPAPAEPYYGRETVEYLGGYGFHVRPSDPAASRITHRDPASSGTPPRDLAAGETTPPRAVEPSFLQKSADPADRGPTPDRNPGRVGDGSVPGRSGSPRRSRRGGRRRGGGES